MPRKKLARRFDPFFGVSKAMVDAEAKYIGCEVEDYLLRSLNELAALLSDRRKLTATAEINLQVLLQRLPDRQRLALRCLLARDFLHIAALYETYLKSGESPEASGTKTAPAPEEIVGNDQPVAAIPFSEWLFDPQGGS